MNIKGFLFTGLMTVLSLSSCSDLLDEVMSSDKLRIEVADEGNNDKTRAVYSEYTTSFENGDKIGVYVVKDGRVITANACYTYDGSAWTTTERVGYNEAYSYYAYYPYIANPYNPDFSKQFVNDIFEKFIKDSSNKFHKEDQSTKESFQASDLMIANGSKTGSNTVAFAMAHMKGLAVFSGKLAMAATFSGINKPFAHDEKRYFHMKPETATSFTDNDTGTYSMSASSGRYVIHEMRSVPVMQILPPEDFLYSGGSHTWNIQSYITNESGTIKVPVGWYATFDKDGNGNYDTAPPSWLTNFTSFDSNGSVDFKICYATAAAQTASNGVDSEPSTVLAEATEVRDYDLSMHTVAGAACSRTTANCYMVHAAGTYKLPLVYGNAIKNGATNSGAYKPSGTNNNDFLTPFLNHAGNGITDPWLKNNGAAPNGAKLIWQDRRGLISSVGISGDYLTFSIDKSNITEGNAVIAATKNGTVVWSWHIWVTPEKYETLTKITGTNYKGTYTWEFNVTHANLGWVDSHSILWEGYPERTCKVKIRQDITGVEQIMTIRQKKNYTKVTPVTWGTNTYYQWGRKDPLYPAKSYDSSYTDVCDINGNNVPVIWKEFVSAGSSENHGTIANGIKYPNYHYHNRISGSEAEDTPFQTRQYNLWNATASAIDNKFDEFDITVKTIYDPCPAGFCIPSITLGWAFSVNNSGHYNTEWDSTNKGQIIKDFSPNVFFPATGHWNYASINSGENQAVMANCQYGRYWESMSHPTSNYGGPTGSGFYCGESWISAGEVKSYGQSIRPVVER